MKFQIRLFVLVVLYPSLIEVKSILQLQLDTLPTANTDGEEETQINSAIDGYSILSKDKNGPRTRHNKFMETNVEQLENKGGGEKRRDKRKNQNVECDDLLDPEAEDQLEGYNGGSRHEFPNLCREIWETPKEYEKRQTKKFSNNLWEERNRLKSATTYEKLLETPLQNPKEGNHKQNKNADQPNDQGLLNLLEQRVQNEESQKDTTPELRDESDEQQFQDNNRQWLEDSQDNKAERALEKEWGNHIDNIWGGFMHKLKTVDWKKNINIPPKSYVENALVNLREKYRNEHSTKTEIYRKRANKGQKGKNFETNGESRKPEGWPKQESVKSHIEEIPHQWNKGETRIEDALLKEPDGYAKKQPNRHSVKTTETAAKNSIKYKGLKLRQREGKSEELLKQEIINSPEEDLAILDEEVLEKQRKQGEQSRKNFAESQKHQVHRYQPNDPKEEFAKLDKKVSGIQTGELTLGKELGHQASDNPWLGRILWGPENKFKKLKADLLLIHKQNQREKQEALQRQKVYEEQCKKAAKKIDKHEPAEINKERNTPRHGTTTETRTEPRRIPGIEVWKIKTAVNDKAVNTKFDERQDNKLIGGLDKKSSKLKAAHKKQRKPKKKQTKTAKKLPHKAPEDEVINDKTRKLAQAQELPTTNKEIDEERSNAEKLNMLEEKFHENRVEDEREHQEKSRDREKLEDQGGSLETPLANDIGNNYRSKGDSKENTKNEATALSILSKKVGEEPRASQAEHSEEIIGVQDDSDEIRWQKGLIGGLESQFGKLNQEIQDIWSEKNDKRKEEDLISDIKPKQEVLLKNPREQEEQSGESREVLGQHTGGKPESTEVVGQVHGRKKNTQQQLAKQRTNSAESYRKGDLPKLRKELGKGRWITEAQRAKEAEEEQRGEGEPPKDRQIEEGEPQFKETEDQIQETNEEIEQPRKQNNGALADLVKKARENYEGANEHQGAINVPAEEQLVQETEDANEPKEEFGGWDGQLIENNQERQKPRERNQQENRNIFEWGVNPIFKDQDYGWKNYVNGGTQSNSKSGWWGKTLQEQSRNMGGNLKLGVGFESRENNWGPPRKQAVPENEFQQAEDQLTGPLKYQFEYEVEGQKNENLGSQKGQSSIEREEQGPSLEKWGGIKWGLHTGSTNGAKSSKISSKGSLQGESVKEVSGGKKGLSHKQQEYDERQREDPYAKQLENAEANWREYENAQNESVGQKGELHGVGKNWRNNWLDYSKGSGYDDVLGKIRTGVADKQQLEGDGKTSKERQMEEGGPHIAENDYQMQEANKEIEQSRKQNIEALEELMKNARENYEGTHVYHGEPNAPSGEQLVQEEEVRNELKGELGSSDGQLIENNQEKEKLRERNQQENHNIPEWRVYPTWQNYGWQNYINGGSNSYAKANWWGKTLPHQWGLKLSPDFSQSKNNLGALRTEDVSENELQKAEEQATDTLKHPYGEEEEGQVKEILGSRKDQSSIEGDEQEKSVDKSGSGKWRINTGSTNGAKSSVGSSNVGRQDESVNEVRGGWKRPHLKQHVYGKGGVKGVGVDKETGYGHSLGKLSDEIDEEQRFDGEPPQSENTLGKFKKHSREREEGEYSKNIRHKNYEGYKRGKKQQAYVVIPSWLVISLP